MNNLPSWIIPQGGSLFDPNAFTFIEQPTIDKLEQFILEHLIYSSRVLRLNSYAWVDGTTCTVLSNKEIKAIYTDLFTLGAKIASWQFSTLTQSEIHSFEINFCDVDSWLERFIPNCFKAVRDLKGIYYEYN